MELREVERYVKVIIPNIEKELANGTKDTEDLLELYNLYLDVLRMIAPYDFITFNKYLEIDEDKGVKTKGFYHHRKYHLGEVFDALNNMEIYDKYDMLLISTPPRVGKSTTGIRFLAWITGRHPENTQLATSYSDNITSSFYIGVMEVVEGDRYKEVFEECSVVNRNAKRQEIWLKVFKRYPSITFVPINGSMTGRAEAGNYLYCDDLVSGIEEAMSIVRLNSLWQKYTVNAKQRKKDGCKEIHIATRWSVHDPITKLTELNRDNPRCKIVNIPCYNEDGESNFDFFGGFSTKYYNDMEAGMDSFSFGALYMGEPIEREGLLYHEEDMQYYLDLPEGRPDTIIGICDSKNLGNDYVAGLVGYVYGDLVYIDDVVFNSGLPEVTRPLVAKLWNKHDVVRADIEMNNGGNYYAEGVNSLIKQMGGRTSIRMFFTGNNKQTKIITYSDYVKDHFIFRDRSTYKNNSEYGEFMKSLFSWTQSGKNPHDDAPDAVAMMAQLIQDITGSSVKILDRKRLGL